MFLEYDDFTSFVQLSYSVFKVSELDKLSDTDLFGCMFWASKFQTDAAKLNLKRLKTEFAWRELGKEIEKDGGVLRDAE